ncbi:MAG: DEAD/DEAH box helicase, partial [Deltaproteobacteria bacterium]|nr:DEAD/DEAH box helicase [Deltaproteobacteria bacterium]
RKKVRALIIAPTRELAEQTHAAIGILGRQTRLKSVTIYGGVGFGPQVEKLRRGAEIIVACPGRLLDHLGRGTIDLSLVETLVLDEADHMFDMGFLPDIKRVLAYLPKQRQTLLFSATMPPEIRHLAGDVLNNPVTIQVGETAPVDTVNHALYPVAPHLKTPLLLSLLHTTATKSVLVFARTKHRTKRLAEQIVKAGHKAASLQGNLSQSQREAAMGGFRDGRFQILVATDIAARGIDVSEISHVINYDIPNTTDAYIHRIGRTGRATRSGDAYTLVSSEDKLMVRAIEKVLGSPIERRTVDGFDYEVNASRTENEFFREPQIPVRRYGEERKNSRPGSQGAPRAGNGARPNAAGPKNPAGKSFIRFSSKKPGAAPRRRSFT